MIDEFKSSSPLIKTLVIAIVLLILAASACGCYLAFSLLLDGQAAATL